MTIAVAIETRDDQNTRIYLFKTSEIDQKLLNIGSSVVVEIGTKHHRVQLDGSAILDPRIPNGSKIGDYTPVFLASFINSMSPEEFIQLSREAESSGWKHYDPLA